MDLHPGERGAKLGVGIVRNGEESEGVGDSTSDFPVAELLRMPNLRCLSESSVADVVMCTGYAGEAGEGVA